LKTSPPASFAPSLLEAALLLFEALAPLVEPPELPPLVLFAELAPLLLLVLLLPLVVELELLLELVVELEQCTMRRPARKAAGVPQRIQFRVI
jgi:hypothetical protein